MADQALDNAKTKREQLLRRREDLAAELSALDKDLAKAEDFIAQWYQFAGEKPVENLNIAGTPVAAVHPIRGESVRKATVNSKKEDVAAEVRRIIEEYRQPVLRKDLMPILLQRGYKIEGSDPDMVLSTMLWRAGKSVGVIRLRKGGYWLADYPWPMAGYKPGDDTELDRTRLEDTGEVRALEDVMSRERVEKWQGVVASYLADMTSDDIARLHNVAKAFTEQSARDFNLMDFADKASGPLSIADRQLLMAVYRQELDRQYRELGR